MAAVILLSLLPFSSYVALLPSIQADWELSNGQAAIVFSAYLVGYAASSLVLVPLTDRISARRVLVAGLLVAGVANLAFPFLATDMTTASALRFVAGAGHVAVYVPGIQLVSTRFAAGRRGTAVSVFVAAAYAGTTMSYVVTAVFANITAAWQDAFLLTSLVSLGGLALAAAPGLGRRAATAGPYAPTAGLSGRLDLAILRHRPTALVIGAYSLHSAELYLARLWLPLLLGASLSRAGRLSDDAAEIAAALAGLMFALGIAGVFVGGALSDRIGRARGAMVIFAFSGVCSFTAGWLVNFPPGLLIAVGFAYGFATAADSAIYSTAVTEYAPAGRTGSSQAVQSFAGFSIGAVAPVVAGSILDVSTSSLAWGLAFSFNGLLAAAGVLLLLLLHRSTAGR
jgi:MFS family permease